MALATLSDIKTYLGETTTDYDTFLTDQLEIVSDAIEQYCERSFNAADYTEEFFRDEINSQYVREIFVTHYPVVSVTSVSINGETTTDYRKVDATGLFRKNNGWFNGLAVSDEDDKVTIEYRGGYETLPALIRHVLYGIIEQNYNKKISGVNVDFGSNVQRVSIPGTISVDYDYTLETNQRNRALGVIIGDYANVLDQFRSDRSLLGSKRGGHVY